jgi:protein TonB
MTKKLRYCFLLVLLLHLLLFFSFSVVLVASEEETKPEMDEESKAEKILPSYVYREQPTLPAQPALPAPLSLDNSPTKETSKQGILKAQKEAPKAAPKPEETRIGEPSKTQSGAPHADPANLIADKPTDKPLIKLLIRATGAHLFYPKAAQDFRIMGIVRLQFHITPEGIVSEVKLLRTSGSSLLDDAGLYAINHISPVKGVDAYLKEPRTLSVGIIFGD